LGQAQALETEKAKMMNQKSAADAAAKTNEMGVEVNDGLIRIREMAKRHGVTMRTLRFYEDKGLLAPRRKGSTRLYTRRDNARLKLILLGRKVGFPLREVKKMIDLYDPSGSNSRQLKYVLDKSRKQLAHLHNQRKAIDEAIGELNEAMKAVRSMLAGRSPATGA
jgi:DNA-binding transcriptional MerR regulator